MKKTIIITTMDVSEAIKELIDLYHEIRVKTRYSEDIVVTMESQE